MQKFQLVSFIFGLFACHQSPPKQSTKILDFGAFSINSPASWEQIKERGTDSYVGKIALDKKDTLDFDLGWYSNKLDETDPVILDSAMISSIDTSSDNFHEIIFVKNRMAVDMDKYIKNNVSWYLHDRSLYRHRPGWKDRCDHFNLYGNNLSPDNEKKVLEAIRTLKFRKK